MGEKRIFVAAWEIAEPSQPRAFLDNACRDQPELRHGVERLLAARPPFGDFLETPPPAIAAAAEAHEASGAEAPELDFLVPSTRPSARLRHTNHERCANSRAGRFTSRTLSNAQ